MRKYNASNSYSVHCRLCMSSEHYANWMVFGFHYKSFAWRKLCNTVAFLPVCEHFERLKETNPNKSKPHLRNVFNDEIISELQARLILLIERINFAAKVQIYFIKFERKCFIFNMKLHFLCGCIFNLPRWNFRNFESLRC